MESYPGGANFHLFGNTSNVNAMDSIEPLTGQQGAPHVTQPQPIQTVTIEFNAILSSRYQEAEPRFLESKPSIFVHLKLHDRKLDNILTIRPIESKYVLLSAYCRLPKDYLDSNDYISYSYRVGDNREAMPNSTKEDRQLDIQNWERKLDNHGILRQYDFVIHKDKDEYSDDLTVKSRISNDIIPKVVVDAQFVMLYFLPPWEGFSIFREEDMSPKEALRKVRSIWRCLATARTFYPSKINTIGVSQFNKTRFLKPNGFELQEVLVFYLSEKINSYRNPDDMDLKESEKQLISALAITQLVNECNLKLSTALQRKLCLGLKFPVTSPQRSLELLQMLRNHINENVGNSLAELIGSIPSNMYDWMLVLPLFHFLSGITEPYKPLQVSENSSSAEAWWGVQTLKRQKIETRYGLFEKAVIDMACREGAWEANPCGMASLVSGKTQKLRGNRNIVKMRLPDEECNRGYRCSSTPLLVKSIYLA
ncbi:uncharacterized protein [Amphiura filiformis]|uniref:uncharacterized protein n=1 Tax=Amphiura filiformis TaxID=82378 RepID=UPI003B219BDE